MLVRSQVKRDAGPMSEVGFGFLVQNDKVALGRHVKAGRRIGKRRTIVRNRNARKKLSP